MTTDATRLPDRPTVLAGSPSTRALIVLLASGVLVFSVLAALVAMRWAPLIDLDTSATAAAYHAAFSTGWLRAGARGATVVGSPGAVDVVAAAAVLGLALARRWSPALAVAAARLGELGIETATKLVLDRPRPAFTPQLATASGASFPSGHAAGSAAVYVVLLLLAMPWLVRHQQILAAFVVVLILAIAASRLLLGVHYPSDVIAGLGLGWACAAAAVLVTRARRRTGQRPEMRAS